MCEQSLEIIGQPFGPFQHYKPGFYHSVSLLETVLMEHWIYSIFQNIFLHSWWPALVWTSLPYHRNISSYSILLEGEDAQNNSISCGAICMCFFAVVMFIFNTSAIWTAYDLQSKWNHQEGKFLDSKNGLRIIMLYHQFFIVIHTSSIANLQSWYPNLQNAKPDGNPLNALQKYPTYTILNKRKLQDNHTSVPLI